MIDRSDLAQFWGTECYYRIENNVLLTDGAHYVAEKGGEHGAYWLMTAIASYQPQLRQHPELRYQQFWKLRVRPDKTAVLTCVIDSGYEPTVIQEIPYTDFDLTEIDLWVGCGPDENSMVIYLPSEH